MKIVGMKNIFVYWLNDAIIVLNSYEITIYVTRAIFERRATLLFYPLSLVDFLINGFFCRCERQAYCVAEDDTRRVRSARIHGSLPVGNRGLSVSRGISATCRKMPASSRDSDRLKNKGETRPRFYSIPHAAIIGLSLAWTPAEIRFQVKLSPIIRREKRTLSLESDIYEHFLRRFYRSFIIFLTNSVCILACAILVNKFHRK